MRRLDVVLGGAWAEVSGWQARDLLVEVGAKPVWLSRLRVWSVSHNHGCDAIALAESRGYLVAVQAGERR